MTKIAFGSVVTKLKSLVKHLVSVILKHIHLGLHLVDQILQLKDVFVDFRDVEALVKLLSVITNCLVSCISCIHIGKLVLLTWLGPLVRKAAILLEPLKREEAGLRSLPNFLLAALLVLSFIDRELCSLSLRAHPLVVVVTLCTHRDTTWKCGCDQGDRGEI